MREFGILALSLCTLAAANGATITLTSSGGAVPDNNTTGVTFDVSTTDTRVVTGVEIFLTDFSHPWIGDLIVTLEHVGIAGPVTVLNRTGISPSIASCSVNFGCSSNFVTGGTYTFATAGTALSAVPGISSNVTNIPFDIYTSSSSLAPLAGATADGTWRLSISDNATGDVANTTWSWGVNLTVDDATVPEPSTLSMLGLALGGIAFGLRRRR